MKIIYHHYKDPQKETLDVLNNWWTCPPELECTKKQEDRIEKIWRKWNGPNAYITDPLGCKQCLYIMLSEIPFGKLIKKFLKKEHIYDVYDL